MRTRTTQALRAARARGLREFITTPTRVASTGLVIPPIRRSGKRRWRLECDWSFESEGWIVTVPEGRETDLADIPRVLVPFINDFQFGVTGPLLHDFIYEHAGELPPQACRPHHGFRRWEADRLLWKLMRLERVPWWRRVLAWVSVRVAGGPHWRRADGRSRMRSASDLPLDDGRARSLTT